MMGVNYYEDVVRGMGASTTGFMRLFMVPGMFHCNGGVGPDRFDALTALTEWVEKGNAPQQMKAAQLRDGKEVRMRPLCPYPRVAIYNGSGSFDDAANFTRGVRPCFFRTEWCLARSYRFGACRSKPRGIYYRPR